MAKHTAGEWGVALIDGGSADDEVVTVVNGCMVSVATVFGAGEYSEARPNGEEEPHHEVSKEEAEANALPIAAAPDLLEFALMFDNSVDVHGGLSLPPEEIRRLVKIARAAIAKAKGE